MSHDLPDHLEQLGGDLDDAWSRRYGKTSARLWLLARQPRRLVVALALIVVFVVGGVAIGASVFKTAAEEEQGILGGHLLFSDSAPKCEPRSASSFRCTLDRPPTGMTFYEEKRPVYDKFLGVKVETVDSSKHVDGGCVSISADGRTWNCYLGQRAVEHGIISADFLGQYLPQAATG